MSSLFLMSDDSDLNIFSNNNEVLLGLKQLLELKSGQRTPSEISMNEIIDEDTNDEDGSPEASWPPDSNSVLHSDTGALATSFESSSSDLAPLLHPLPSHPSLDRLASLNKNNILSSTGRIRSRSLSDVLFKDKSRRVIFPTIHPSTNVQKSDTAEDSFSIFRSHSANSLQKSESSDKGNAASKNSVNGTQSSFPYKKDIGRSEIDHQKLLLSTIQPLRSGFSNAQSADQRKSSATDIHQHTTPPPINPYILTSRNLLDKVDKMKPGLNFHPIENGRLFPSPLSLHLRAEPNREVTQTKSEDNNPCPSILRNGKYSKTKLPSSSLPIPIPIRKSHHTTLNKNNEEETKRMNNEIKDVVNILKNIPPLSATPMHRSGSRLESASKVGLPNRHQHTPTYPFIPDVTLKSVFDRSDLSHSTKRASMSHITRHASLDGSNHNCKIRFDPRVWVHEFQRPSDENIWFTSAELERFKYDTLRRIQKWNRNGNNFDFIPSGTGRIISTGGRRTTVGVSTMRALFSNPALSADCEDEDDSDKDRCRSPLLKAVPSVTSTYDLSAEELEKHAQTEFQSLLIVDPHDIFISLLTKGLRSLFPNIKVTSAHTSEEAWTQILIARNKNPMSEGGCTHGFDLIVVEERLILTQHAINGVPGEVKEKEVAQHSGSDLIRKIKDEESMIWTNSSLWHQTYAKSFEPRFSLLIGISARLTSDYKVLEASGADFIWGKPPPRMDADLRCKLLCSIMAKRRRGSLSSLSEEKDSGLIAPLP